MLQSKPKPQGTICMSPGAMFLFQIAIPIRIDVSSGSFLRFQRVHFISLLVVVI